MTRYDSSKHRRRSIRLPQWDYRALGYYFVTICTWRRETLFANPAYHDIAAHALQRVPQQPHARHVQLDGWVIMPNHVHVIFLLVGEPLDEAVGEAAGLQNAPAGSLGVVVGRYKTAVSTPINQLRRGEKTAVWQRGYYERIIRNDRELQATRQYIADNPLRWAEDRDNLDKLLVKMTRHPHGRDGAG
ncbi:MAG: transposase [Chloroflexota bacterium]